MDNELYFICDRLKGFTGDQGFEVIKAEKTADGTWSLTVKKTEPKEPEEEK